jgi:hypothetical protein
VRRARPARRIAARAPLGASTRGRRIRRVSLHLRSRPASR